MDKAQGTDRYPFLFGKIDEKKEIEKSCRPYKEPKFAKNVENIANYYMKRAI